MSNPRQRYQNLLTLAKQEFPALIQTTQFIDGTFSTPRKARITFYDRSFLDIWISPDDDYAYHWEHRVQDGGVHRWDNAPHYPRIQTYPHHIHDGSENNVVESNLPQENAETALRHILKFIEAQLTNRAPSH